MIRWCAYCQHYLGESPPFDDYRLTHGICAACEASGRMFAGDGGELAKPLRDFHDRLRTRARQGALGGADELLDEALALGVTLTDLGVGLLQPLLHEVGDLWAQGLVSVAQEHLASHVVSTLLERAYTRFPQQAQRRQAKRPEVLLVPAPDNRHVIGLQLLELLLTDRGVPTAVATAGVPASDVAPLVRDGRPRIVGVSISQPSQLDSARAVAAAVAELGLEPPPKVVVGGGPVRLGLAQGAGGGLSFVKDADALVALLPGRGAPGAAA